VEEVNLAIEISKESMQQSVEHLDKELMNIRAGKASPGMVGSLLVSYYGAQTPVSQVASVSNADARTLVIQPWEKSMLAPIERAIFEANLGVTPQNDGEVVRIVIPPLTEERRRDLVKRAKQLVEDAKVGVRSARQKGMDAIKKAVKDGLAEDMGKRLEAQVQGMTDDHVKKIEEHFAAKEKEIMTV
jgi:ribosome recycling factor